MTHKENEVRQGCQKSDSENETDSNSGARSDCSDTESDPCSSDNDVTLSEISGTPTTERNSTVRSARFCTSAEEFRDFEFGHQRTFASKIEYFEDYFDDQFVK